MGSFLLWAVFVVLLWAVFFCGQCFVVGTVGCGHCFAMGSPCCAAGGTWKGSSAQLAA